MVKLIGFGLLGKDEVLKCTGGHCWIPWIRAIGGRILCLGSNHRLQ